MKKRTPNEERSTELWDAYLRDNTDANRNALVEHYWPTVRRLIWRYIRKLPDPRRPSSARNSGASCCAA